MIRSFGPSRFSVALGVAVALTACSDAPSSPAEATPDGSETSATPVATSSGESRGPSLSVTSTTTTSTTSGTVGVTGCTGTVVSLTADEKRSLDLHNDKRVASGLRRFCVHPALTAAARAHSQDMMAKGYFSHTSLNGDTFVTRVVRAGYTNWRTLAENIGWGSGAYNTPEHIFTSWMNSSGHRANIMNVNLREIGIGVVAGTFKTYANAKMYTVDFGTRY